ncbi:hypothetical protein [Marinovum sp.]|uniref:hypothetical protein n=1 Tax=Marinovum sp. TaxID=2024839 RepID=UPI003A93350D
MTKSITAKPMIATAALAFVLSGCSAEQAVDSTIGVAAGATKVVAKGAVGAGKLVYKGGKAIANPDG